MYNNTNIIKTKHKFLKYLYMLPITGLNISFDFTEIGSFSAVSSYILKKLA